ncbi:MAG: TonB-dependent receptor [Deltaproteobacteria bacterium]|nr:MAG: TonB-dependent receptor [Deltaproteobacteria bacterium]
MPPFHDQVKKILVLLCVFFPGLTEAAQTQGDDLVLEPVLVTAEKRSENVQDIPTSIAVRSELDIADAHITTLQDLSNLTPNLYIANWGIRGTSYIFSRGIGAVNNEPAMGFYVDDVGYMDPRAFDFNLFDIERIEVLRGPQGTLYGRNALAGVINIVTKKPDNRFHGSAEYGYGKYNMHQGGLHIQAPLVDDKLFLGLAGNYASREGFSENEFLDKDVDSRESINGRAKLRWTPSSALDVALAIDAESIDDGAFPLANLYDLRDTPHKVSYDHEGAYERDVFGGSLHVEYDAPQFTLTSISAYRSFDDMAKNDQDFTFLPLITSWEKIDDNQLTQEFRLGSADTGSKLKWLVGLYGFRKDKEHFLNLNFAPGFLLPGGAVDRDSFSDVSTSGGALFGQFTYNLFTHLDLTAGLRYDYEHNDIKYNGEMYSHGIPLGQTNLDETQDSEALLPKFQIAYHKNSETMVYAGVTRGYRSGGFNPAYMDVSDQFFDSEYSWNYEIGVKTSWLNDRLTANASLFYITLQDQQIVQLLPSADTVIRNGGEARSQGFELESTALLARGLTLEAGIGYTDAVYTEYTDKLSNTDYSDKQMPLAPEYTYNLALQYRKPMSTNLNLFSRIELNGVGDFYWNDANTLQQDAYSLVNIHTGVESEKWDILFWARNLFDTEYEVVAFEFPGSQPIGQSGDPRIFGLTVRYRF